MRSAHRHRCGWAAGVASVLLVVLAGTSRAQRGGFQVRMQPPAVLAITARRAPDFDHIRFLTMQRSFRQDLHAQLLSAPVVIRHGRPVAAMPPLETILAQAAGSK